MFRGCYFAKDNFINESDCTSTDYWGASIVDIEQEDGLLIKENSAYKCRSWATSVSIPNNVTSIENYGFQECSNLINVTIGNNVTSIGIDAFKGVKLHTIRCKAERVPTCKNTTVFSPQTLAHAPLYVPEGSWENYAFDDYWYQFANIKEFSDETEQVAATNGYTLMDENYQFAVYDKLNDCICMVAQHQVDEQNFCTSWTMQEIEGKMYLYNLGAEKYVVRGEDGSLSLTAIPTAVDVENVAEGIRINDNAATWNFVKNENIYGVKSLEEDVTGIISVSEDKTQNAEIYNLSGQRVTREAKGIVIQNGKKILVK